MLKFLLLLFAFSLLIITQAQDSLSYDQTPQKPSFYMRMMPISTGTSPIYSSTGVSSPEGSLLKNRISQNIEAGISTSILDIGLSYGRMNFRQDSTSYLEARITMVTCQIQKFSNEFSIGFGHSFNNHYPIMLEAATTMLWQVQKNWGAGLIVGYYDFAGNQGDYSKNFYGVFIRYGLERSEAGLLMRRRSMIHRQHRFR